MVKAVLSCGQRQPNPRCAAILLLLLSAGTWAQAPPAQDTQAHRSVAQPAASDTVSGAVTSATDSRPLAHALVTLYDLQGEKVFKTVTADDEGSFRFPSVPAGRYRLTARAKGFLQAHYLEHDGFGSAIVTGAGRDTQGLLLKLNPEASISGHVLDEAGDPIENAAVALYREAPEGADSAGVHRFRNAQTDSTGNYEFIGLAPGTYFLAVTATPWYAVHPSPEPQSGTPPYRANVDPALDVAYPITFYPHALSSERASPLVLQPGEEAHGDMQLVPEHALSINLRIPPEPKPQSFRFPQVSQMIFGTAVNVPVQSAFMNGVGSLSGLTPGEYLVQLTTPSGFPSGSSTVDLTTASIAIDSPPETPPGKISVTLRTTDGALPDSHGRLLLRAVDNQRAQVGAIDSKGTAEFLNLPPGSYRFSFSEGGRARTISAILENGQPLDTHRVQLDSGQDLALTLSISSAPVKLSGVVQRDGKPMPGTMVVLVPAGADTNTDLFRRDQSDLDGGFTFSAVIPDKYLVVAIEDGWSLRWNDTATLMPYLLHSVPVEVGAKAASLRLDRAVIAQPR